MMPNNRNVAAAALMRQRDEILLVEQQAPEQPHSSWALPGGIVETNELLLDGLAREVREETGLTLVDPGSLLYVAQGERVQESWMAFIFDVREWTGDLKPDDPDGYILDARFLPISDAIDRLDAIPWQPMREPIVAYLREETGPGAFWCYRDGDEGEPALVRCLPGANYG